MNVLRKVQTLQNELQYKKGQQEELSRQEKKYRKKIEKLKEEIKTVEQAQKVLQTVAKETQNEFKLNLDSIASLSLSVLQRPYDVSLDFKGRRNKTDCFIRFHRNEKEYYPLVQTGGGVVEMLATALRCAVIKMAVSQPRKCLILDEPFRFLGALRETAIKMILQLSEILEMQIILTTHDIELIDFERSENDRLFVVENKEGISKVKRLD